MVYSNSIRSYNNMLSRTNNLNYSNNYITRFNGSNNSYRKNGSINSFQRHNKNNYVNNLKGYAEYNKSSKKFYKEFKEKFESLKESSSKLKSYSNNSAFIKKDDNFNSESGELVKNKVKSRIGSEDKSSEIIKAVEDFASDYNDTLSFLNNNSTKSDKVSDLAQSYTNIVMYNKSTLSGIGVNVDANGKLTVDKDKLAIAIRDNKNSVRNALGDSTSGVANKIYNKTAVAIIQSKELYPASKLKNDYINNTYFYNPNNSSILQSNQLYSSGLFLNLLL